MSLQAEINRKLLNKSIVSASFGRRGDVETLGHPEDIYADWRLSPPKVAY